MDQNNLESFKKELKELCDKYKVTQGCQVIFPQYRVLPVSVQLALKVLEEHKGVMVITIEEEKKEDKPQG